MLSDGAYEQLSLCYGADLDEEAAGALAEKLEEMNEDWEVEVFYGGQPLYPLLLAME